MHRPIALVLVFALVSIIPAQEAKLALQDGLSVIEPKALRETVSFLASDELKGRDTPSPELDKAAAFLAKAFADAGASPAFGESFFQGPLSKDEGSGPGNEKDGFYARNVGAFLLGSDPTLRDEVIVFTAHYDHIGQRKPRPAKPEGEPKAAAPPEPSTNVDLINNGADDNASGTAGVLQILRAQRALPRSPKRSTLFLCFYGEERGMKGSRYFCANPSKPLRSLKAVFNLEMIGRPEDIKPKEAWITGFEVSNFGALVAEAGQEVGVRFYENGRLSKMLFTASDNISFARLGVPAHSISAGSLHKDYHQPTDESGKIDYENMAAVTQGIFCAGMKMADGGEVPRFAAGSKYEEAAKKLSDGK